MSYRTSQTFCLSCQILVVSNRAWYTFCLSCYILVVSYRTFDAKWCTVTPAFPRTIIAFRDTWKLFTVKNCHLPHKLAWIVKNPQLDFKEHCQTEMSTFTMKFWVTCVQFVVILIQQYNNMQTFHPVIYSDSSIFEIIHAMDTCWIFSCILELCFFRLAGLLLNFSESQHTLSNL